LLLLLASILEVAVPYRLPTPAGIPVWARMLPRHREIGGLHLLSLPAFGIALACQAVIAALVLLGLRWLAAGGAGRGHKVLCLAGHWHWRVSLARRRLRVTRLP
jgi:hypothetical protein